MLSLLLLSVLVFSLFAFNAQHHLSQSSLMSVTMHEVACRAEVSIKTASRSRWPRP